MEDKITNADIAIGSTFYLSAEKLKMKTKDYFDGQCFKVVIYKIIDSDQVMITMRHYKTRKCNKVTVVISRKLIIDHGIRRPV